MSIVITAWFVAEPHPDFDTPQRIGSAIVIDNKAKLLVDYGSALTVHRRSIGELCHFAATVSEYG